jgi:excinuclease ABC subunit C
MGTSVGFDVTQLQQFPTSPGVYLMRDKKKEILYIGKAKNIKVRVKQYFIPGRDTRAIIPLLTAKVSLIDTIVVASEKEALLLESTLIKKHKPRYNALLKDDKSYISLKITTQHAWPMIQLVRLKGPPAKDGLYFGPYISAYAARQTLELMKKVFPLRQCSDRELLIRKRPCILYQMKRCIAPCVALCTPEEYDALVKRAIQFLKGNDREILKALYLEMELASEALEFERANSILLTIQQLEKTLEEQHVEKIGRADCDAIGYYREGEEACVVQLFFRQGKLLASKSYSFSQSAEEDEELLSSFILQAYAHSEDLPAELLLPLPLKDAPLIALLLSEGKKRAVKLLFPQKGDKRALQEMAHQNAHATFERQRDAKASRERTLLDLQERLRLNNFPRRIECFDNSHLSGTAAVAAMAVYEEGEKAPRYYRKYALRETDPSDDYGALREVLRRRYAKAKEEGSLPDLILVDGGKGQLSSAVRILEELDISTVDIASIAKDQGRHDRGMTLERIFMPQWKEPVLFKPHSPALLLLQQIRDEAHRVAITFQRKKRGKETIKSDLETLPGIGPAKRKLLLQHFGSVRKMKECQKEELSALKGISARDVETLWKWIRL